MLKDIIDLKEKEMVEVGGGVLELVTVIGVLKIVGPLCGAVCTVHDLCTAANLMDSISPAISLAISLWGVIKS